MPPDGTAARAALGETIDRDYLYGLAIHEKAAPVLVSELERLGLSRLVSGYRELQHAARLSVMQMLQLERLLHQAVDTLAARGIEALLLKGAGLAYTAYPSFADRPMSDLDLLVRPQDAERAWSELQTAGWTWPSHLWAAGRYTTHHHFPPLVKDPGGFRVEIHTDLLPAGNPFRFTTDMLWERMRRVPVDGRVLCVPHPIHQLWHACVHFAWSHQMQWGSWRTLRDCAALCGGGEIDWAEFSRLAIASRAGTCCYWTLRLAHRLAAAQVPQGVLTTLRPPGARWWLDELERHYACSLFPSLSRCPSVWLSERLWVAGIMPAWSGHRRARPWHAGERWVAGGGATQGDAPLSPASLRRLRGIGAWFSYLRRIHRLSLPSNANHPERQESSHVVST
jgi:hypothetical protein